MAVLKQIALHYKQAGSDKVWAGAYTDDGQFLSAWGRRGACKEGPAKACGSVAAAQKLFDKKSQEKLGEGYIEIPFDDPGYGVASFGGPAVEFKPADIAATGTSGYYTSHVMPLDKRALEMALDSLEHGISEKANGERCVVVSQGGQMAAFNRRGKQVGQVPYEAQKLAILGDFAVDGERMTGDLTGHYVIFDLLEWQGEDIRPRPYSERIAILEKAMRDAGLLTSEPSAVLQPVGLHLLIAETDPMRGRQVAQQVYDSGGEGVIIRTLAAPYQVGDTQHVRKLKYVADVDCVITGIKPGQGAGSLAVSLYKDDGSLLEVATVRSGLNDADVNELKARLAKGEQLVITVTYLPARTVGLRLVEPTTSLDRVRDDKLPSECTIHQLGADKAALAATA